MPVNTVECPCTDQDISGCDLPRCSSNTYLNSLCEANDDLPDGNTNYNVKNCPRGHNVFERIKKGSLPQGRTIQFAVIVDLIFSDIVFFEYI